MAAPRASRQADAAVVLGPARQIRDEIDRRTARRASPPRRPHRGSRRRSRSLVSDCSMPYGAITRPNRFRRRKGSWRMSPRTQRRREPGPAQPLAGAGQHRQPIDRDRRCCAPVRDTGTVSRPVPHPSSRMGRSARTRAAARTGRRGAPGSAHSPSRRRARSRPSRASLQPCDRRRLRRGRVGPLRRARRRGACFGARRILRPPTAPTSGYSVSASR